MSGDNQCAVAQPLVQALNKLPLGMFIQRGAGFVEQHDIGRSQQHSCQQDRLPLSTGQTVAALHNGVRQPFGELFNESCRAADLQRFEDLRVAGMRCAEGQVLAQGAEKQPRVLAKKTDVAA